ncbi:MAG TPA: 2-C-methyl-D-erythritol 2,4-cyclodiphosphate synthase [Bacteroidales bacterium]|jgi:2-C-methyl-D-erythritol 2,4-cyclodiphosphate synthase|nr:2-C-methyl-D-erythritol 2,4-cyclodiphosphate synthase [Bacteroidales bacterium]HPY80651.1 2-C-methyl-D-erythritol 2,4-cyclodiphosphate synthase [Bacteroidales bacterium]
MDVRIGFGYDSHQLAENISLFLGGVQIPHAKGCVAHSDGDVLIHALCDALLGAAALPDIGSQFPDNNPDFKNIDSKILLSRVVELIENENFTINNIDITLLVEKPKIAPYREQIVRSLQTILKLDLNRISLKAKTNEKMGFVGREEGVVAYAVVTLIKNERERK